jgi:hypothetical protein
MKIAKLVEITMLTRVIVDIDTPENEVIEKAIIKASEKICEEGRENVVSVKDDTECPFDPEFDTF